MKPRRLDRINELLRVELGKLMLHELRDPRLSEVVSITAVQTTPDLHYTRVYVSVLGGELDKRRTLQGLKTASGYLRRELGRRVVLKYTPQLQFFLDESIEEGSQVLDLMRDLERAREE